MARQMFDCFFRIYTCFDNVITQFQTLGTSNFGIALQWWYATALGYMVRRATLRAGSTHACLAHGYTTPVQTALL